MEDMLQRVPATRCNRSMVQCFDVFARRKVCSIRRTNQKLASRAVHGHMENKVALVISVASIGSNRIVKAITEGPVGIKIDLDASREAIDKFRAVAIEAGERPGCRFGDDRIVIAIRGNDPVRARGKNGDRTVISPGENAIRSGRKVLVEAKHRRIIRARDGDGHVMRALIIGGAGIIRCLDLIGERQGFADSKEVEGFGVAVEAPADASAGRSAVNGRVNRCHGEHAGQCCIVESSGNRACATTANRHGRIDRGVDDIGQVGVGDIKGAGCREGGVGFDFGMGILAHGGGNDRAVIAALDHDRDRLVGGVAGAIGNADHIGLADGFTIAERVDRCVVGGNREGPGHDAGAVRSCGIGNRGREGADRLLRRQEQRMRIARRQILEQDRAGGGQIRTRGVFNHGAGAVVGTGVDKARIVGEAVDFRRIRKGEGQIG